MNQIRFCAKRDDSFTFIDAERPTEIVLVAGVKDYMCSHGEKTKFCGNSRKESSGFCVKETSPCPITGFEFK